MGPPRAQEAQFPHLPPPRGPPMASQMGKFGKTLSHHRETMFYHGKTMFHQGKT